jgi:hypothetical protein
MSTSDLEKEFDVDELRIQLPKEIKPTLDDNALIQGLLPEKSVVALIGPSNCGKSALALDLSAALAMGKPFRNLRVQQCGVLYIACEGAHGLRNRVTALRTTERLSGNAPLGLVTEAVDLCSSPRDSERIIRACAALRDLGGSSVGLIVIDTVARAMNGADENSGADMGSFLGNVESMRQKTDATILLIHHAGKDMSKGARGHSSFKAALDTEITVEGANNPRSVTVTKQRDLAPLEPFAFELAPILVGSNRHNEEITAVVVEHSDEAVTKSTGRLGKNQAAALIALKERLSINPSTDITSKELKDLLARHGVRSRQRAHEVIQFLVNIHALVITITGYRIEPEAL